MPNVDLSVLYNFCIYNDVNKTFCHESCTEPLCHVPSIKLINWIIYLKHSHRLDKLQAAPCMHACTYHLLNFSMSCNTHWQLQEHFDLYSDHNIASITTFHYFYHCKYRTSCSHMSKICTNRKTHDIKGISLVYELGKFKANSCTET